MSCNVVYYIVRAACWLSNASLAVTSTWDYIHIVSVVKSRWLCYFVESTSICLKFYFVESRSSLKNFYFLKFLESSTSYFLAFQQHIYCMHIRLCLTNNVTVLQRSHFWLLTDQTKNWNPPKPVIGLTKYRTEHSYKLTLYRTYSQNVRNAISTSVTTCLREKGTK